MKNTKLIDCTIRDGGHLNNWDFSLDCVRDSYNTACMSNIDFFEIGYRNYENSDNGRFYTCYDDFIFEIVEPNDCCKIAVMADMTKSDINLFKLCEKNITPISAVFVATYLKDLKDSFLFCEKLFDKGYLVFLNLMAMYEYTEEDFLILNSWLKKDVLEAVYFADSFGSFYPQDIVQISNKLKNIGFKNIGFHSHNNMQLAFANTIKAIDLGLYSVDGSVYGMGRDAGNLQMELLLSYLNQYDKKFNPTAYLELIEKYYLDLHCKLNWGYNINSLLGGVKKIHPKQMQELSKTKNFAEIYNLPVDER